MADQDSKTGQFLPGNTAGKGRPKGSRNKLTQKMLDRFSARNQDGISVEEILFDIMQDKRNGPDMQFKAAAKLADLVFPKAQSVEIEIEKGDSMSLEDMDARIAQLLSLSKEEDKDE